MYCYNIMLLTTITALVLSEAAQMSSDPLEGSSTKSRSVLSRRKRYLLFPDSTSFQLVFCVQTSALIPIGDIFLYGSTLALGWALPTDPQLLTMFKNQKVAEKRKDLNDIYYLDKDGKVLAKVPYKRKPQINPVFTKRSIDEQKTTFKEKLKNKLDRMKMHEKQKKRDYLNQKHMNEKTIEFHRSSRLGLYKKLEKLFTALGRDGRQCVLRKLCESRGTQQGTFLQELATVLFTLPKSLVSDNEDYKDYDRAHHSRIEDCSAEYPDCDDLSIFEQI